MSDKITEDIKEQLQKFASRFGPELIVYATVKAVDEATSTITAVLDSGLELDDVRLRSVVKAGSKVIMIPSIGSKVLIGKIQDDPEFVVLAVEAIEKVLYVFGTVKMEVDATGFLLGKGTETLKKLLEDLIAQIKAITVPTNSGPSGVPLNIAALTAIATRVDNLLN